jgi:long-subunit fatty acid transport protein
VRHSIVTAICGVIVALSAVPCEAQDGSRITGTVFTNPGARSIGLGGAFVAIADDATAAFANPAGLVQILRPEVSMELRFTASYDDADLEPDQGLSGLGFFSFVLPTRSWALALYSHQMGSVAFGFDGLDSAIREFTVRSYAAAAAVEISENLSLGAGLSYFDGDRSSGSGVSGFSDSDWGFNAGVLWKASSAWNLAGFYRQGPEFASREAPTDFSFPNEYGVGVAFQPDAGALTIGFEWDHVGSMADPRQDGQVTIESGSEVHLGAEYAVLRWKPVVAFRAGWWRESTRQRNVVNRFGVERSFPIEDRNHVAFGFGLAFQRFQIDAGVDFFDADFVGSASFVYSF